MNPKAEQHFIRIARFIVKKTGHGKSDIFGLKCGKGYENRVSQLHQTFLGPLPFPGLIVPRATSGVAEVSQSLV